MIYINPYLFGESSPPAAGKVVSLMHFDTSPLVDEVGNIWTPSGSPQISAAESVFGGASLYLSNNSYLSAPNDGQLTMRDKAFCFEARIRPTTSNRQTLVSTISSIYSGAHEWAWLIALNRLEFYYGVRGAMQSTLRMILPATIAPNEWQSIAIQRNSNGEWGCWLNGVKGTSYQNSPPQSGEAYGPIITGTFVNKVDLLNNGAPVMLGRHTFGEPYTGYIDEFRYSIGQDVYTDDYTPATAPFPYP